MVTNNDLSAAQKLDAVLSIFPIRETEGKILHNDILSDLLKQRGIDLEQRILEEVMRKLLQDGYIRQEDVGSERRHIGYRFHITFDGELFRENGGYKAKFLALNDELQWKVGIENTIASNSGKLNTLTFWLTVGTTALFLLELTKFVLERLD